MYAREGLIDKSNMLNASKSTKMQAIICYFSNNIRFVMLYTSKKVSTKDKLEKITTLNGKKKDAKLY